MNVHHRLHFSDVTHISHITFPHKPQAGPQGALGVEGLGRLHQQLWVALGVRLVGIEGRRQVLVLVLTSKQCRVEHEQTDIGGSRHIRTCAGSVDIQCTLLHADCYVDMI